MWLDDFKRFYLDFQLEDELLLHDGRGVMTGKQYQRRKKQAKQPEPTVQAEERG